MGAPSSGLIAEIFLQHTEQKHLPHITHKHKIINYCRYVGDILIIFDSTHTNIQQILNEFNTLHPKLHFTTEMEKDQSLNYLDVSIHRTPTDINTAIYRKPTFTDTIIPYTSNHPAHHKYASQVLIQQTGYLWPKTSRIQPGTTYEYHTQYPT